MKKAQAVLVLVLLAICVSSGFNRINSFAKRTASSKADSKKTRIANPEPKEEWVAIYDSLGLAGQGLSLAAFHYAWYGFQKMHLQNPVMAIADFSQSSCKRRLYVIDLLKRKLLLNTYVAHGRNSGQEYARSFSNDDSSYQSSLGFYRTRGTYQGKHGLSLKLEGVEKGINDRAMQRAIVMHGADYVSEDFIKNTGRLGRSLGCPAVSIADSKKLINMLYDGAGLFIYSMDQKYFKKSGLLAELATNSADQTPGAPRL
jgi:hypothetical protein